MQEGSFDAGSVMALETVAYVNGIKRKLTSWSINREITGDLPDQVVGGKGLSRAGGSISWAVQETVVESGRNPWNNSSGWIPMKGDRVTIYVSDGTTQWLQGVFIIQETSGSIGGGLTSSIEDESYKFNELINLPALMTGMPPLKAGDPYRRVGMSSRFTMNTVLRESGFYTTPARELGCVLDVPLQSSLWPLRGTISSGSRRSDTSVAPPSYESTWGTSTGDFTATYTPDTPRAWGATFQLSMLKASDHNDFAYLAVYFGTQSIELRTHGNGAYIRCNGVTLATVTCPGGTVAVLLVKGNTARIRTSTGADQSVTLPTDFTPAGLPTRILTAAGPDARVAGYQMSYPSAATEFQSLAYKPNANITVSAINTGNLVLPAITNETASKVLDDIGDATLRPCWIDETGKAVIIASDTLYKRNPVQRITTLNDIRSLSWRDNYDSIRSDVRVRYLMPTVNSRTTPSIEAWQQTESVVLQSGESQDIIMEPDSNEDWIMPDLNFEFVGRMNFDQLNRGEGSVGGGIYTNQVEEKWAGWKGAGDVLTGSVSQLGANQFLLRITALDLEPGWQVELRTFSPYFSGTTSLWPYWRDRQLPRLAAYAVCKWSEVDRAPVIAAGQGKGVPLEHNAGPWLSSGSSNDAALVALEEFLTEQVKRPMPVITGMEVGYDPRRQLGDVIYVSSPDLLGVELKCLIVGIDNSASESGFRQSLSVKVIYNEMSYTTYAEFANAWGNQATYATMAAAWGSSSTYNDFRNDPLKGT